ncbi:fimbrillin family protein [Bacteroides fragilis]|nr:fimbrillin family protein [Bacteroides fragilis]
MKIKKCKIDCFQKSCILLCMALFSCSQYDCVVPDNGKTGEGERASLGIGGVSTGRLEVLTRSVTAELTAATDAIGIFRKEDTGKGYEPVHNRKYTYGTPLWETDGEEVVLIDKPAELTAYYPYREDGASSVGLSSELYVASKEIYYCPFKASNSTGPITLNLRRAYALLRFNFIRGIGDGTPTSAKGEYTGDGKISSFTFKATLRIAGILDLFTGTVEGEAREVAFNYNVPISIGTTTAPAVLDYMVVPSDFTGELSFTLMVDGKEMKGKISASDLCGTSGKLAEGTKYEINAIIRPTEVEIGTVEVEEWIGEVVKDPSGDPFVPQ